jgi:transposase InsO family protein
MGGFRATYGYRGVWAMVFRVGYYRKRVRRSVAFAIDCHDREVFEWPALPRPLTGADIRTLMNKALWARFGDAALKAPHAVQWLSDNGPPYTATASVLYAHELGLVPITDAGVQS